MHDPPTNIKELLIASFFSLAIIVVLFLQTINQNTKIVFCDVGQGDATYIRIQNQFDILIDTGPNNKILRCLGKYMPFYDRQIELIILTHHHQDHYGGLKYLINRYQIKKLFTTKSQTSSSLKQILNSMDKTQVQSAQANQKLKILNQQLTFLWPPQNYSASNENNNSLIIFYQSLSKNNFKALFTGDALSPILNQINQQNLSHLTILKIPHHGSKNGLNSNFLELADPQYAVISVGKKNSFGHPNQEVLETLKALKIKILRTDQEEDIIFNIKN